MYHVRLCSDCQGQNAESPRESDRYLAPMPARSVRAAAESQRLQVFGGVAGGLVLDPDAQLVVAFGQTVEREAEEADEPAFQGGLDGTARLTADDLARSPAQLHRGLQRRSTTQGRRPEHLEMAVEQARGLELAPSDEDGLRGQALPRAPRARGQDWCGDAQAGRGRHHEA